MTAIKNYASDIPINRIFERIQQTLVQHGAKQITFDYDDNGAIGGVAFVIAVQGRMLPIKLPARVDKAQVVLKKQYDSGVISRSMGRRVYEPEQAYRVAWRNILDWLEAQMALLDIEMAKLEEIFLPYITNNGKTLFEFYEERQFLLPGGVQEN
jgi:hypothetical protein